LKELQPKNSDEYPITGEYKTIFKLGGGEKLANQKFVKGEIVLS
jgi:hypothetical protein